MSGEKLCRSENQDGTLHGWMFECPGCERWHVFDKRWTFVNNDEVKPTFVPSLLCKGNYGPNSEPYVCHSYVTDGRIQFLADCTHKLAGQTVDMLPWEDRKAGP